MRSSVHDLLPPGLRRSLSKFGKDLARARRKRNLSEETGPEATVEALLSVIAYFRIPLARAKEILGEIERAVSGWRDRGRALGMTDRELEPFADAFEHPTQSRPTGHELGNY